MSKIPISRRQSSSRTRELFGLFNFGEGYWIAEAHIFEPSELLLISNEAFESKK